MRGSVKVDKDLLVAKLEAKLAELRNIKAKRELATEKHKKAHEAWVKKATSILLKKGEIDSFFCRYDKAISITWKSIEGLPEEPQIKDFTDGEEPYSWSTDSDIANIEEFLKVMTITSDDKISMAIVNNMSKYL